jgi:hypothetical protein
MERYQMKLSEFCKRLNVSKPTAMKILKEGTDRVLLNGCSDWLVTKRGLMILDNLTHTKNNLCEQANRWITEQTSIEPENENEVLNNLKQIRYNIMALVSIQDQNPELDIQGEMATVFQMDLSDMILKIDNYINSKTAGE